MVFPGHKEAFSDSIYTFVDCLTKCVHLVPTTATVDAARGGCPTLHQQRVQTASSVISGLSQTITCDRDPRFTAEFFKDVFHHLGTEIKFSTANHPQTDGQSERANRVVGDILRVYYRKRGSASYIVREVLSVRERERYRQRERERERDGSDVTIVALKLAMNLHFPLPKIRTVGDELTLSLAKNSHFSFLPSHFPSLPSRRGHHCGADIRNEFTLSIAKKIFALFVPPL